MKISLITFLQPWLEKIFGEESLFTKSLIVNQNSTYIVINNNLRALIQYHNNIIIIYFAQIVNTLNTVLLL